MKLTKQDKDHIIKEYKLGKKAAELAKKYKVSTGTIYNLISAADRSRIGNDLPAEVTTEKSMFNSLPPTQYKAKSQILKEENDEVKIMYAELALKVWRMNSSDDSMFFFDKSPAQ